MGIAKRVGKSFIVRSGETLPPYCIYCGKLVAGEYPRRTFYWRPLLKSVFLDLPYVRRFSEIFHWVISKNEFQECTILVPLCRKHINPEEILKFKHLVFLCFFVFFIIGMKRADSLIEVVLVVLCLPFLALYIALSDTSLRATYIGDDSAVFAGACEKFLAKLEADNMFQHS